MPYSYKIIVITLCLLFLSACSSLSSNEPVDIPTGDDIMQGPGLFTGDKGAFYIRGGEKKVESHSVAVSSSNNSSKSISEMNLNETSKVLDDKIRQLQRDQMELELLKREVDRKLKN